MDQIIRVLVVDDSAYVRKVIKQMLSRSPFIEVVGIARNGVEALELVEQLHPDVLTLDLMMPEMDGVAFLQAQMMRRPLPVIVVSIANEASDLVLKALDAGAIDFVQKPTALANERMFEIADDLIAKIKAAASVPLTRIPVVSTQPAEALVEAPITPKTSRASAFNMIVLGISTGGPQALKLLIPQLPADFPIPIAIVMHMPVGYTEMYARALNDLSPLQVIEANEGAELRAGVVLIAPAGRHLTLARQGDGRIVAHLDAHPFDTLYRPSVDVLFQSAAEMYEQRVLGIVMTGMGTDGQHGAAWVKARGGTIWAESEESCVVYGMPRAVIEAGLSDRIVSLHRMAQALRGIV
jgi:two-component system, chemotaxis family, protein-glutamate methylesterase/glutaminase